MYESEIIVPVRSNSYRRKPIFAKDKNYNLTTPKKTVQEAI